MTPRIVGLIVLLVAPAARAKDEAAAPAWRYDVSADAELRVLTIDARLDGADGGLLSVDDGAEPFIDGVELELPGGRWRPVASVDRETWRIAACVESCHLRYRFRLRAAAVKLQSDVAGLTGGIIQAPPSTWLLRPMRPRAGRDYHFVVHVPSPWRFVTGVQRRGNGFGADVALLGDAPWSAFGPLAVDNVSVGDAQLELAFSPELRGPGRPAVTAALAHAAAVVRRYYGSFPVPRLLVLILPTAGDAIHGRTLGNGGATMQFIVGDAVEARELARSWVPVHELIHVAFPTVPWPQMWIDEGLATYLEPVARVRAGDLEVTTFWRDLVEGLPQGQPGPGDRGLDHTRTWGRTYWGGALFCLLADVEIRERTHNARSLDDAMRGILRAGGNVTVAWPLERALAAGDAALGQPVLTELRRRLGEQAVTIDLAALWKRLGVRVEGGQVQLDDSAPLAAIRRAITAR
jgi:predicted metalloprotease with PDZ domain